jgi:hypothetical protein
MEESSCEGDFQSLSYRKLSGQRGIQASAFIGLSKLTIHKRGINEEPANYNYIS